MDDGQQTAAPAAQTIEARIDSLETGAAGFQQRIVALESKLETTAPTVEEFAKLKADFDSFTSAFAAAPATGPSIADLVAMLDTHGIRLPAED